MFRGLKTTFEACRVGAIIKNKELNARKNAPDKFKSKTEVACELFVAFHFPASISKHFPSQRYKVTHPFFRASELVLTLCCSFTDRIRSASLKSKHAPTKKDTQFAFLIHLPGSGFHPWRLSLYGVAWGIMDGGAPFAATDSYPYWPTDVTTPTRWFQPTYK